MSILNRKKYMTYSRYALSGLAFFGMTLLSVSNAQAQGNFNNPNVSVDFSVLEDNGVTSKSSSSKRMYRTFPTGDGYLQMPSPNTPVSTFVPLPETVTLTKPAPVVMKSEASSFTPPPALPKVAAIEPAPPVVKKPKRQEVKVQLKPKQDVGMPKALPMAPKSVQQKTPDLPPATPTMKKVDAPPPPPAVKKPAVTKETIPAPKMVTKPKPVKVAALTPKATPKAVTGSKGDLFTIGFDATSSKLSNTAKEALKPMAASLKDETGKRLQILAYAGGDTLSPSRARRLSLSRALAVRSYLIDQGLRSTRIDVRALGSKVPDGAPNRVDLKVIAR
ncbi:MAG: OmpA family protein [Rhodospirillales bacterium]|nr:OmpA family protein [Rhodospirillales bacterium]